MVHFIIVGAVAHGNNELDLFTPRAIARSYMAALSQPRGAWTSEIELRSHVEPFLKLPRYFRLLLWLRSPNYTATFSIVRRIPPQVDSPCALLASRIRRLISRARFDIIVNAMRGFVTASFSNVKRCST